MSEFLTIVILHLFAVASPGPDFVLVTRQCFRHGRTSAIWSSFGIAFGIMFHVLFSLLGLAILINYKADFFVWLKLLAAVYLIYLGLKSVINISSFDKKDQDLSSESLLEVKAFLIGFTTNLLNPKALLFFITVFSLIINTTTSIFIQFFYGLYMSLATFFWFTLISFIFTSQSLTKKFNTYLPLLERITGFLLIIIACQILFYKLPI